jgi:hypothetical protein
MTSLISLVQCQRKCLKHLTQHQNLKLKLLTWVYDKFNKANLLKESFTFSIDAKCFESFKTKRILSGPTLRFFERISKFKIDIQ